jgi:hypothetical protein
LSFPFEDTWTLNAARQALYTPGVHFGVSKKERRACADVATETRLQPGEHQKHRQRVLSVESDAGTWNAFGCCSLRDQNENAHKLENLHTYVERNQAFVANYGERFRKGKRSLRGSSRRRSIKCQQTDGEETQMG